MTFDNFQTAKTAGASSITYSHTCSGNNLVLLVFIEAETQTDIITGVTYNGVSMTRVTTENDGGSARKSYAYILTGPATGANNVVVSISNNAIATRVSSVSYIGAKQSNQPDASGVANSASATSLTVTTNVVNAGSWVVCFMTNGLGVPTASTNINAVRGNDTTASMVGDSNGGVPVGNYSQTATAALQAWEGIGISLIALPSGGFFSFMN